MQQVTVYREDGRYCGWPANEGLWSWGSESDADPFEIVVGSEIGYMKLDVGTALHRIDRDRPRLYMQCRSSDGGATWEPDNTQLPTGPSTQHPGGIDFTAPGFGLRCRDGSFYLTDDRARTWRGPYALPTVAGVQLLARTDYQVYDSDDCLVFLTTTKPGVKEGRRSFCMRTTDGGTSWRFVSWIGPEPGGLSVMPSSARLGDGRLLCALRRKETDGEGGAEANWIELWTSQDEGESWEYVTKPAPDTGQRTGNPPSLVVLPTGRLALTYGYRGEPLGIRARTSDDDGVTWSNEIMLRDDAGDRDLGYTRTVVRPDGKLVTMYYIDDKPDGERYIGGTIWEA